MVQWLRICLPMKGIQVRSLICMWPGKIPHAAGQPSPCATSTKACTLQSPCATTTEALEPMLCNKRSHCNEKPVHPTRAEPPAPCNQRKPAHSALIHLTGDSQLPCTSVPENSLDLEGTLNDYFQQQSGVQGRPINPKWPQSMLVCKAQRGHLIESVYLKKKGKEEERKGRAVQDVINRIPQTRWLRTTGIYFSRFKIKCWQIWCLLRAHFVVQRLLSSCSTLTWWKGPGSSLGSLLQGALMPFLKAPLS